MQCKFLQVFSVTGYPLPFWQKNIQTGGFPMTHTYISCSIRPKTGVFASPGPIGDIVLTIVGQATALSPVHSILICLLL